MEYLPPLLLLAHHIQLYKTDMCYLLAPYVSILMASKYQTTTILKAEQFYDSVMFQSPPMPAGGIRTRAPKETSDNISNNFSIFYFCVHKSEGP